MSETCTLCGLPLPDPPITGANTDGRFCCQGCLDVASTVSDLGDDPPDPAAIRDRAQRDELTGDRTIDDDLAETFLTVEGMHCTTCEAFLALRGESTDGIESVDASYATETVRVIYDPEQLTRTTVADALTGYGYSAATRRDADAERADANRGTRQRLTVGIVLAMLVMPWYVFFLYPSYVGIETGILSADMTTSAGLYLPMSIIALFSAGVVFVTGWPILRGAWVSLRARRPNMDLLIAVAVLAAFAYSLVALATGSIHLYFDVAIAIVLVVTAGGYYEDRLRRDATDRLSALTAARVTEATQRRPDGSTETVEIDALEPGDVVVVSPGERIPVDGTVRAGQAAVDEALVTGESLPSTKTPGDQVLGGTVVTNSALVVAVGDAAQSTLDRVTNLLWRVQSERHGAQRFVDRLATVFVPLVLVVGVAVFGWRLSGGASADTALLAGLTVLVAACPCAMGLATPLAVAAGLRDALRKGMIITSSSLFERAPGIDAIVFDKTGTLTTGDMEVREVVGDPDAVAAAAALERRASHPVAAAIESYVTAAPDGGAGVGATSDIPTDVRAFERHPGSGVSGVVGENAVSVVAGTPALVETQCGPLTENLAQAVERTRSNGNLPVVVGVNGTAAAVIVVGDRERAGWEPTLDAFDDRTVVVLTGDDWAATTRFRAHEAVDRVLAGVPPDGKVAAIEGLAADRSVAMVGDGTNDAPALAAADVGIAVAGTAHAADAADVVVGDGALDSVPAAFDLAEATRRRIRENVGWALCYNGVALPLAAVGALNPLLAALAMAGSSILVVTNSRRRMH